MSPAALALLISLLTFLAAKMNGQKTGRALGMAALAGGATYAIADYFGPDQQDLSDLDKSLGATKGTLDADTGGELADGTTYVLDTSDPAHALGGSGGHADDAAPIVITAAEALKKDSESASSTAETVGAIASGVGGLVPTLAAGYRSAEITHVASTAAKHVLKDIPTWVWFAGGLALVLLLVRN